MKPISYAINRKLNKFIPKEKETKKKKMVQKTEDPIENVEQVVKRKIRSVPINDDKNNR